MQNSRFVGKKNEDLVISYLQENGFVIVDRNFYAKKFGEIDIIALKDEVLHFIEVKSSKGSFDAVYNVTPTKLKRVINSVQYYLQQKKLNFAWMIDVIVVNNGNIRHIENVTL
jgi:putative endonuclease